MPKEIFDVFYADPPWKYELRIKTKELLLKKNKKYLKTNIGGNHMGLSDSDKAKHNTRVELAKELNWSTAYHGYLYCFHS